MDTLKLNRPMMHGPAVVRLQELLDKLGYGDAAIDGIFGPDTQEAVLDFQDDMGLKQDGIVGRKTWWELRNNPCHYDNRQGTKIGALVDRRDLHPNPRLYKCKRTWSQINGVTLHQTGCEMPERPSGWDRLNAHIGITQEGVAILVNDPTDFIWHAQGLSQTTIGIEIEGNYCGVDGDMETLWRGGGGPHHLNPDMLEALRVVRLWLIDLFVYNHQDWSFVFAHRQAKNTRIADPGEEIWKQVGIPWINQIPGVTAGPNTFYKGTGRPIPYEWDDRYIADYNCAPGKKS